MKENQSHLDALQDIRKIMDKSTRFISLSGLSGIAAGVIAIIGAWVASIQLDVPFLVQQTSELYHTRKLSNELDVISFVIIDALLVLIGAIASGLFFTIRKSKKNKQSIWSSSSKRMLIHLLIPLMAGGLFSLILVYHGMFALIAPAMLLFYGMALINASKFTLHDIKYLGLLEIILGLFSAFFLGFGLLFWTLGFGVLHIVYGSIMYFKYEK